jgi:hypothetical protein
MTAAKGYAGHRGKTEAQTTGTNGRAALEAA